MDETLSTYSGQPVRTNGKLNSLAYPHYFKNTGKRGKKNTSLWMYLVADHYMFIPETDSIWQNEYKIVPFTLRLILFGSNHSQDRWVCVYTYKLHV